MRIVMMATGDIAIPSFKALAATGNLAALVTQPDRPVGRHLTLTPPRIKTYAAEANIPVLQPESMRAPEAVAAVGSLRPDIIVVMAYGQILSQAVIDLPAIACINAHASLLPRHRGASCIQAAIDAGDAETGVTIMHVVKKLDAGDIILQGHLPLRGTETADDVHDALATLAPELLCAAISQLQRGETTSIEQDEQLSTYAPKLLRPDGRIDWAQPAYIIARKIRAYHSWPGTFTIYPSVHRNKTKTLKIYPPIDVMPNVAVPPGTQPGEVLESGHDGLYVACAPGVLRINTLQPEGSRKMNAESFFSGHAIYAGMILGAESTTPPQTDPRSLTIPSRERHPQPRPRHSENCPRGKQGTHGKTSEKKPGKDSTASRERRHHPGTDR